MFEWLTWDQDQKAAGYPPPPTIQRIQYKFRESPLFVCFDHDKLQYGNP